MIDLMRTDLKSVTDKLSSAHAGLLLNRGLLAKCTTTPTPSTTDKDLDKKHKTDVIATVCKVTPCNLYKKAFDRWVVQTAKTEQFRSLSVKLDYRLFIGLATGGAIETGVSTQHSYGMPMIAGSAVKGVAHTYAQSIGLGADVLAVLFGEDEDTATDGRKAGAGCLIWHDAWWYPHDNTLPFIAEVVTVHHQEYYGGNGEATDFDSPIPNQQVAVQGSFYFVIEGETQWAAFAKQLLQQAVQQQGLGAKTAAGYGYFKDVDKITSNNINDMIKKAMEKELPEYEKLMLELTEKIAKLPKGGGIGGSLGQDLKALIAKSKQWPPESYSKLTEVAQLVYNHVGADRKKKGPAKDLWQTLPK